MNISVLQLCLKYAEASSRLQDSFTEVSNDFQSWLSAINLSTSDIQGIKYMINIMTAIIDNEFCGEWIVLNEYLTTKEVAESYESC